MRALEWLISNSTVILAVVAFVVALTGLPKTKVRYRILAAALLILCACSSVLWYESYYVAQLYYRDRPGWLLMVAAALFLIAIPCIGWETFALRLFHRYRRKESNQSPHPTLAKGQR